MACKGVIQSTIARKFPVMWRLQRSHSLFYADFGQVRPRCLGESRVDNVTGQIFCSWLEGLVHSFRLPSPYSYVLPTLRQWAAKE